jgi:hypothetical protein
MKPWQKTKNMTDAATVSLSVVLGCVSVGLGVLSLVIHNSVCDTVHVRCCGLLCMCRKGGGRGSRHEPNDGEKFEEIEV